MKKSLLALALVAGFAQANETTLYGRVTGEAEVVKKPGEKAVADLGGVVRFGIKGNEDLNAGLKAIYQMEFNYNFKDKEVKEDSATGTLSLADKGKGQLSEVRQAYVGLQGDFGTLKLGKQSSVHGLLTNKADFSMNYGGALDNSGTESRVPKAISYVTPDMGGVSVAVATILDGSGTFVSNDVADSKSFRAYEVGVQYAANGLEAAAVYAQLDSKAGVKAPKFYGASVAYNADTFGVGFDFESNNVDKNKYFALGGEYKFTTQDRVYAGVEFLDVKAGEDRYFGHLGYRHDLSKRTRVWVEAAGERNKNIVKGKNGYRATVGLRHDF